jgi:hypothetical protein
MSCSVTPAAWDWKASSRSALGPVPSPDWLKFKNPEAPAVQREAEEDWGKRAMTTLTMRMIKGDFVVTGPDVEPMKFKTRREAREWCWLTIRDSQSRRLAPAASANHQRATETGRQPRVEHLLSPGIIETAADPAKVEVRQKARSWDWSSGGLKRP